MMGNGTVLVTAEKPARLSRFQHRAGIKISLKLVAGQPELGL
jgi:hypothetical protein